MRLIDADGLIATLEVDALNGATIKDAIEVVKDSPTVDAVEIVRCGDCRFYVDQYCHANKCYVHSKKYFCVFGETEEPMKKKRGIKC